MRMMRPLVSLAVLATRGLDRVASIPPCPSGSVVIRYLPDDR